MRMFRMTLWSACVATALAGTVGTAPGANAAGTIVVAQDGTGDYRTVQAAINAVPTGGAPYVVLIGKGISGLSG